MKKYNISFVLPMFNEAANIEGSLGRISALAKRICDDYEIVVVDDASTDGSGDIIDRLASGDPHIKSVRLAMNTKFGGALRTGIKSASRDIVVYTDSDFPAKEDDIKKALELLDGSDIVTAYSLVLKDTSLKRILISKTYNFLVGLLFRLNIRDINSGLKIYKRSVFKDMRLKSESPFIDVEIFAEAKKRGLRIRQYGLIFELRTKGVSNIARTDIIAKTFLDMMAYRFSL